MVTYIYDPKSTFAASTVVISDHSTPASATYAIGLRPQKGRERWTPQYAADINTGADTSLIVNQDGIIVGEVFQNIQWAEPDSGGENWENFKKAIVAWNDYDDPPTLYLSHKNKNAYEEGKWPVDGTMTQIQCKIMDVDVFEKTDAYKKFNLTIKRVTA